ncbi:hypothetical protein [Polynucleobacter sp. AP-Sving-400A-A2]|uniref:hypothetical protein n=1 Tax=Polynucleobacter sp. AP-Sving-400A-A2 TaxID=2081049 RepID=UPI001BFCE120|nr:hypothetical protein [Polynucleobacter sp. AP-Sving-400A-A2]QWE14923.1 hypothetical protein C2758_01925 [Polynucleobacter sp. AP-Sving-400A-A2]
MRISAQFRIIYIFSIVFGFVPLSIVSAQTFSPYTPTQIQEFNSQPIAPLETPAGPVYTEPPPIRQSSNKPFDARYVKNPDGEEQAEAQGAESTAPFEPIPATMVF